MSYPLSGTLPDVSQPLDYHHFCALSSAHWQTGTALASLAETLSGFARLRDLLPLDERAAYEAAVVSWPWQMPSANSEQPLAGLAAIRWLDNADTAEQIRSWQEQHGGALRLSIMTIEEPIARALAQYPGDLELLGLASIDQPSGRALADRPADKGRLSLALGLTRHGIASLDALEPLWSRRDSIICLPAIDELDDKATSTLARCQGTLSLPNLKTLSERHAAILSQGGLVRLELDSLTADSLNNETARGLCSGNLREIGLGAIDREVPAMHILAAFAWGILQLDGLTELPLSLARILQQSPLRHLKLNGLTTLDFATASTLCGTERSFRLTLDGLTALDDRVVSALISNKLRSLEIRNVTQLSDIAKGMLREFGNYTCPALEAS